ncbi:MAG: hypothetical protein GX623_05910 [Clostridiales bacterium]|nr:hypothetical protein [Clostridiales bacterium]
MNDYRYRQKPEFQRYGTKGQQRLMAVALIALVAALVVLSVLYVSASSYRSRMGEQMERRINSNLLDAIGLANRMTGGVQSNSSIRLGQIRQHVFAMDQINAVSIAVGGEGARIIPQEAVSALVDALDRYEVIVQTATGNALEVRTLLLTHLHSLQELLASR